VTNSVRPSRGFAFPFRVDGTGRVATTDAAENVRENIEVLLLSDRFERPMRPDFGASLSRFLHESNELGTHTRLRDAVTRAVEAWETRVDVESVDVVADESDPGRALVTIRYRIVESSIADQLELSLVLGGS
jgi:phage baseplate assembly protein W